MCTLGHYYDEPWEAFSTDVWVSFDIRGVKSNSEDFPGCYIFLGQTFSVLHFLEFLNICLKKQKLNRAVETYPQVSAIETVFGTQLAVQSSTTYTINQWGQSGTVCYIHQNRSFS